MSWYPDSVMEMLVLDPRGVEGFPLKLMITAVVLAITVPMMFGALRTYDRARVEQDLQAEIDEFVSTAQLVYLSGPGNSAVVEFGAPKGAFTALDYVRFGDAPGGQMASVIRYKIGGSTETLTVIQSPNVPMMSPANETLEIMSGNCRIIVQCLNAQADLNGDGLLPDNYVMVSLSGI